MSIKIKKKTSTQNTTALRGRKILYLVIHYTAGTTSRAGSAENTASWFMNPAAQASADFIVDDGGVVQYNMDIENRYCWHCGGSKYGNKGVFTIVEVKPGKGSAAGWGKLKSGAGWLSLDYAAKL